MGPRTDSTIVVRVSSLNDPIPLERGRVTFSMTVGYFGCFEHWACTHMIMFLSQFRKNGPYKPFVTVVRSYTRLYVANYSRDLSYEY